MKQITFLLILLYLCPAYSFNWSKCNRMIDHHGFGYVGISSSATSYLSSTGDCAMIGEPLHDKKVFIARNFDQIKVDSALGQGKYLSAYSSLIGCNSSDLSKLFQLNYIEIFGSEKVKKPKEAFESMELVLEGSCSMTS